MKPFRFFDVAEDVERESLFSQCFIGFLDGFDGYADALLPVDS